MRACPVQQWLVIVALIAVLSTCCAPACAFNTGALYLRCLNNKGGEHGRGGKRLNGINSILGRGRRPGIPSQKVEADNVASQAKETFNSSVSETLLRRMSGWVRSGEISSPSFVAGRASSILESAVDYMQTFTIGSVRLPALSLPWPALGCATIQCYPPWGSLPRVGDHHHLPTQPVPTAP